MNVLLQTIQNGTEELEIVSISRIVKVSGWKKMFKEYRRDLEERKGHVRGMSEADIASNVSKTEFLLGLGLSEIRTIINDDASTEGAPPEIAVFRFAVEPFQKFFDPDTLDETIKKNEEFFSQLGKNTAEVRPKVGKKSDLKNIRFCPFSIIWPCKMEEMRKAIAFLGEAAKSIDDPIKEVPNKKKQTTKLSHMIGIFIKKIASGMENREFSNLCFTRCWKISMIFIAIMYLYKHRNLDMQPIFCTDCNAICYSRKLIPSHVACRTKPLFQGRKKSKGAIYFRDLIKAGKKNEIPDNFRFVIRRRYFVLAFHNSTLYRIVFGKKLGRRIRFPTIETPLVDDFEKTMQQLEEKKITELHDDIERDDFMIDSEDYEYN